MAGRWRGPVRTPGGGRKAQLALALAGNRVGAVWLDPNPTGPSPITGAWLDLSGNVTAGPFPIGLGFDFRHDAAPAAWWPTRTARCTWPSAPIPSARPWWCSASRRMPTFPPGRAARSRCPTPGLQPCRRRIRRFSSGHGRDEWHGECRQGGCEQHLPLALHFGPPHCHRGGGALANQLHFNHARLVTVTARDKGGALVSFEDHGGEVPKLMSWCCDEKGAAATRDAIVAVSQGRAASPMRWPSYRPATPVSSPGRRAAAFPRP